MSESESTPATTTFLTVSEAAEMLKTSPKTVYNLIKSGSLKVTKLGRSLRISLAAIKAL